MTVAGWDYPDFRDEEPLDDREFWEDDVPDHWWAGSENQSLDIEGDYGRADNESSLDDVRELLEGRP